MVTLFTLGIICLAAVILIPVILFLVGLPFLLLMGLLPWLLRIAGVVLLIKALLDKPTRWENFMPAVVAFALSLLIGCPGAGNTVKGVLVRPQGGGGQGGAHRRPVLRPEAHGDAAAQGDLPQHRHGEHIRHRSQHLLGVDGPVGGGEGDHAVVHYRETTLAARCMRVTMSYMLLTVPTWSWSVRP